MNSTGDPLPPSPSGESDEPATKRKWHQKKRWRIGGALLAVIVIGSALSDPEQGDTGDVELAGDGSGEETEPESISVDDSTYDLTIVSTDDVSIPGAVRKIHRVELKQYPVNKDALVASLNKEIQQYKGEAHAVSVSVYYDVREDDPAAFGVWEWAPGGEWGDAASGDPETWNGYQWSVPTLGKLDNPELCTPPTENELEIIGMFWDRRWNGPEETEDETFAFISNELKTDMDSARDTVTAGQQWTSC